MRKTWTVGFTWLLLASAHAHAQTTQPATTPPKPSVKQFYDKPDEWFTTEEGKAIVGNIISWQNVNGGWWKSYDFKIMRPDPLPDPTEFTGPPGDDYIVWRRTSTIDNDATYSELRVLAKAIRVTGDGAARKSFDRGLQWLLEAQYPTGGWPQRFPIENNYGQWVTFNDGAMVGVMRLMKDIAAGKYDFAWVPQDVRDRAAAANEKAIDYIVKAQIRVNGKLAIWCQQHHPVSYEAEGARSYELPALVTTESATILFLLMEIEKPNDAVKTAIHAGAEWYDTSAVVGKRWVQILDPKYEDGVERFLQDDPNGPRLWGRFHDIKTNKPFFVDRTGIPRDSVDQISHERRIHYQYYNTVGDKVLKTYAEWKKKNES